MRASMDGEVVTVFRSRLNPGDHAEYEQMAEEIETIARSVEGFVDLKTFSAPDGERLSLVIFSSRKTHEAWRDHPDHRRAQRLGRRRFYRSYDILVCKLLARRRFDGQVAEEAIGDDG